MNKNKFSDGVIQIIGGNFLNRQICMPKEMKEEEATRRLNELDLCGTTMGWVFTPELGRVQCDNDLSREHVCFHC